MLAMNNLIGFGAGGSVAYTTFDSATATNVTLSGGDLIGSFDGSVEGGFSTAGIRSRDYVAYTDQKYCEITIGSTVPSTILVGVAQSGDTVASGVIYGSFANGNVIGGGLYLTVDQLQQSGSNFGDGTFAIPTITANAVIQIGIKNNYFYFGVNDTWADSKNLSSATGVLSMFTQNAYLICQVLGADNVSLTANFGASAWAYTPPSGFTGWLRA